MAREITGRHVLIGTVSAFSVIIAVNVFMAYSAISTFPGVEAKNTYYASQNFNAQLKAQQALGWEVAQDYADGQLVLKITDEKTGAPGEVADLQVLIGRATEASDDRLPVFVREAGAFVAPVDLAPGKWILRIEALAKDGTTFRQQRQLYVKG
ncbi:MAG: FixH family protein [Rhodobacterales bacterium]|nr:FixH family protein [Rhodobacterales bacterium]MDX5499791.1 FixH family protein [Rhodobacterales bacterium]